MNISQNFKSPRITEELLQATASVPFFLRRMMQDYPPFKEALRDKYATNVIVIGASTGGAKAVESVLKRLSSNFPAAIIIAQHIPSGFSEALLKRLRKISALPIELGKAGMEILPGKVILAPGGRNMIVKPMLGKIERPVIDFLKDGSNYLDTPSVDKLMESAASIYKKKTIAVVLSGLGNDGSIGAERIYTNQGHVIVQDEISSTVFGMGKSVISGGYFHSVLPIDEIGFYLQSLLLNPSSFNAFD
jgi:two-component system chemotaxis response regulator CheB